MAKNLILYYSRKGENYWNGNVRNITKGNTEVVAEFIQKAVGGDLFEVDTVKPYAADYYVCIEESTIEKLPCGPLGPVRLSRRYVIFSSMPLSILFSKT